MRYPHSDSGCSDPGCYDDVFALGLCLSHYRENTTTPEETDATLAIYRSDNPWVQVKRTAKRDQEKRSAQARKYPQGIPPKEHVVYRHYAEGDVLLYVGYSSCVDERQKSHQASASWWSRSVKMTVESFDSRDEALHSELDAIQTEEPLWNIQGRAPR
jgi:predicted GIY-YIG superfamily endonuclease